MSAEQMRKKIERAKTSGDVEALRMWGKRGAEVTNEKKLQRKEMGEYFDEKLAAEEQARREQANEHIVPTNPEDHKEAA